jgi:hypothetical protein
MDKPFRLEPGIASLLLQVGALAVKTGKFEDGERIIRAVRSCCENVPQASVALVVLLMRQGRWREALHEQQAASACFPDNPLSKTLLALIQRELGHEGWLEQMQEALRFAPEEWLAALSQGSLGSALEQLSTSMASARASSVTGTVTNAGAAELLLDLAALARRIPC